ncbi:hypothetical protein [Citrobacter sedlakii]|uniref:hypothetical protein n=1 Tax=Citrobacter sedlakii TaxID=67826 RepID=UPI00198202AF|nr:hypothetical protein [Citrobacter sedlakii]MBN6599945.1 hypothetical protein [Citrobacter sedlakii]
MSTITMTFTKKQLIEVAQENVDVWQLAVDTDTHNQAQREYAAIRLHVAEIALSSLTAEPIGAFHISDQQVGGTSDYIKDGEWPLDNGIIEVYAAPPVPEEKPMPKASNMFAIDAVAAIAEARGWNACRAAMLQAGNSQVTQDGWKLVPIANTEE